RSCPATPAARSRSSRSAPSRADPSTDRWPRMVQRYLGAIGRTRTVMMHVTDARGVLVSVPVITSIDATADRALVELLCDDRLNVVRIAGERRRLAVPVIYHDPAAGRMVLVLSDAHRHRELD